MDNVMYLNWTKKPSVRKQHCFHLLRPHSPPKKWLPLPSLSSISPPKPPLEQLYSLTPPPSNLATIFLSLFSPQNPQSQQNPPPFACPTTLLQPPTASSPPFLTLSPSSTPSSTAASSSPSTQPSASPSSRCSRF